MKLELLQEQQQVQELLEVVAIKEEEHLEEWAIAQLM